jgi:hypothetical protein
VLHARPEVAASGQVDRATACDGGEPRSRTRRDAVSLPGGEGSGVGVLHALFGDVNIAGDTQRRREDESPLASVSLRDRRGDVRRVRVANASTHLSNRAHFDATELSRNLLRDGERRVEVGRFDDVKPAEHFLGLGEGPVGDDDLA